MTGRIIFIPIYRRDIDNQFYYLICKNGYINISLGNSNKKIGINRIHLEEDSGKSIHNVPGLDNYKGIDLNRCGIPLIEIDSKPEIKSSYEAYLYLKTIKQILEYLNICDGNMEEGSLRCDANIFLRPIGEKNLGVKTELKNLNFFRNVKHALHFEIERQSALI